MTISGCNRGAALIKIACRSRQDQAHAMVLLLLGALYDPLTASGGLAADNAT